MIFIQEIAFENAVSDFFSIFSGAHWVKEW